MKSSPTLRSRASFCALTELHLCISYTLRNTLSGGPVSDGNFTWHGIRARTNNSVNSKAAWLGRGATNHSSNGKNCFSGTAGIATSAVASAEFVGITVSHQYYDLNYYDLHRIAPSLLVYTRGIIFRFLDCPRC